jgi:hypothetical protein
MDSTRPASPQVEFNANMDAIIRMLAPVLAGIRADKLGGPTFPYQGHSGLRDALSVTDACLPLRGQHTLA